MPTLLHHPMLNKYVFGLFILPGECFLLLAVTEVKNYIIMMQGIVPETIPFIHQ